jgi:hypothetical protein
MRAGTRLHAELEAQTSKLVEVHVDTWEDFWAVRSTGVPTGGFHRTPNHRSIEILKICYAGGGAHSHLRLVGGARQLISPLTLSTSPPIGGEASFFKCQLLQRWACSRAGRLAALSRMMAPQRISRRGHVTLSAIG